MESLETAAGFMDDLFDFSSDIGEEEEEDGNNDDKKPHRKKAKRNGLGLFDPDDPSRPLPELPEEELEWISNKDAFPPVETFVDMLPNYHLSESPPAPVAEAAEKRCSPVSVLETSSISTLTTSGGSSVSTTTAVAVMSCCGVGSGVAFPVKARSKRRRTGRRDLHRLWTEKADESPGWKTVTLANTKTTGRKCQHCGAEKTPQWRAGPAGPKTLCNACGVRYKSGRLVPEYRPASSPTFSAELHSNSHRKILEMRRQGQCGVSTATAASALVKPGKVVNKG